MARLFSINIPFENKWYTALVTIREQGHDLCCQVRYIDKSLQYLIPGDLLVFSLQGGLLQPKYLTDPQAEQLIKNTAHALAEQLTDKE